MRTIRTVTTALAALTVATALLTPTTASAKPAADDPPQPEPCVSLALSRGADYWTCNAENLVEINLDDNGEPQPPVVTPLEPQPVVWSEPVTASDLGPLDDWDTWCEYSGICRRVITPYYINETKGNVAYGNSSGAIGRYDVIIRTSLNGRQANHGLALIWDGGPSIDFNDVTARCREDRNNLPDANCGDHYAGGPVIGPSSFRWNSGTLYGNRLANANPYYANVTATFWPTGYPGYTHPPLRTSTWKCPADSGSDTRCKFSL